MEAKQLSTEQEAMEQVQEAINAVSGKRWMAAVWCVDGVEQEGKPDLIVLANRTTWRFPQLGFEEACWILRENLREERLAADVLPIPAPLEMAPFVRSNHCSLRTPSSMFIDEGRECSEEESCDVLHLGDMLDKKREDE